MRGKPRKGGPPLGRPQPRAGGGAVSIEASFASAATEILGETAEVAEEMMAMQRPKRIRSAIALSILAFLNNFLIIVAAFVVVMVAAGAKEGDVVDGENGARAARMTAVRGWAGRGAARAAARAHARTGAAAALASGRIFGY